MNILYLCDEYPPGRHGGIGTMVQLLARTMVRKGHNVVVAGFYDLGYGGENEFDDEGVKVYRFRRGMDSQFFADKDSLKVRIVNRLFSKIGLYQRDISSSIRRYHTFLEGIIQKHNIDIAEMPEFNEYVRFCARFTPFPKLSVPMVVKLHGSVTYFLKEDGKDVPGMVYKMEKHILEQADAVISVSNYTAGKTARYFNYNKQIAVIHNGLETASIHTRAEKDINRVIFSGTLVAKKGIYQLLKAWNAVHNAMPEAELWICGKGDQAKAIAMLDAMARPSVVFKGHIKREVLLQYLGTSQVAVFPSYAEAFALGVMEAMAAGTAVINSERTSGPEIVADGVTGMLINPDNEGEIADKILYLLQNKEICMQFAKAGAIYVREHFDINIVADAHLSFYKQYTKT